MISLAHTCVQLASRGSNIEDVILAYMLIWTYMCLPFTIKTVAQKRKLSGLQQSFILLFTLGLFANWYDMTCQKALSLKKWLCLYVIHCMVREKPLCVASRNNNSGNVFAISRYRSSVTEMGIVINWWNWCKMLLHYNTTFRVLLCHNLSQWLSVLNNLWIKHSRLEVFPAFCLLSSTPRLPAENMQEQHLAIGCPFLTLSWVTCRRPVSVAYVFMLSACVCLFVCVCACKWVCVLSLCSTDVYDLFVATKSNMRPDFCLRLLSLNSTKLQKNLYQEILSWLNITTLKTSILYAFIWSYSIK